MADKILFDFYMDFYKNGSLGIEEINEATKWGCMSKGQFKEITGQEYTGEIES